jgi:hypothetical protein
MRLQILKDLLPFLFKTPINPSPEEQIQVSILYIFYSRELRLFVMSKSVCPWQAFPASG